MASCADTIARWFDLVFAIGFLVLSGYYMVWKVAGKEKDDGKTEDEKFLRDLTLMLYYCFFTVFMFLAFLEWGTLLKYCGFLKGYVTKSLLYIFLATLAFADLALPCIIVGSVFAAMAVFNLFRYFDCCNKEKSAQK